MVWRRGKERSDKTPEEWEQWVHEFAWLHEDVTRPAENNERQSAEPFQP